jgi:oxygen-independent coproporphyrinogen-3 oxidase
MYLDALDRLDAAGYEQYEISNVARPDRRSRHNLKYWTMGQWRGFGCGAHSTLDGERWQNLASTSDYVMRVGQGMPVEIGRRQMTQAERAEEVLFTGLRLSDGLDSEQLASEFGINAWREYGENLATYVTGGLMWTNGSRFGLTRRGMLVSNEILATFV